MYCTVVSVKEGRTLTTNEDNEGNYTKSLICFLLCLLLASAVVLEIKGGDKLGGAKKEMS